MAILLVKFDPYFVEDLYFLQTVEVVMGLRNCNSRSLIERVGEYKCNEEFQSSFIYLALTVLM